MFIEERPQGEVKELDDASRLLLRAAELIELHGWCQGEFGASDGRICMFRAMGMAGGYANAALLNEVRDRVIKNAGPILSFNDQKGRTKAEVISKLRAVALGG